VLCRQVLQVNPGDAGALHLRGVVAYQMGNHATAVSCIGEAITRDPRVADFHNNLGIALRDSGKLVEAVANFRTALRLEPDHTEALNNLGCAMRELGNPTEAIAQHRRSLSLRPDFAEAHYDLGLALQDRGDLREAAESFQRALDVDPDDATARKNLAAVLREMGLLTQSLEENERVLLLQPDDAEVHQAIADTLCARGNRVDAFEHYYRAVQLNPHSVELHNALGLALRCEGMPDRAIAHFRTALDIGPAYSETYNNLGLALADRHMLDGAITSFRRALELEPDLVSATANLMHQMQQACEWSGLDEFWKATRKEIGTRSGTAIDPFVLLTTPTTAEEQLAAARHWVANRLAPSGNGSPEPAFHFDIRPKPKLRIGYLSADFQEHATSYLIAELLELHDRGRAEVFGYSLGADEGSPMRRRITQGVDHFVDLRGQSFLGAAERIYDDGIDVLVDLQGYTKGARTEILALRPAPIQVNYLGYPGTMGAFFMDYVLTDRFVTPPDQQRFFDEQFAYLPDCYQPNDRHRAVAPDVPSRSECGLPEKAFVFCCFNNSYKITPMMFDVWMRLLRQTSGSVLWLLEANPWMVANLRHEAEERRVDAERLIFASKRPLAEHLARHRLADLFLDTLPVNAHTTASDALWAGLPLLTYAGETFAGRVAGSLLTAIGLPELITFSLGEYERRALQLAHHPDELAAIHQKLAANRAITPLFDAPGYTRNLEAAFQAMWDNAATCGRSVNKGRELSLPSA
jgi:predicted O-linked N-acetylglucosamine transferase (SPINDLY family)